MAFLFDYGHLKSSVTTILDRSDVSSDMLELGVKAAIKRLQKAAKVREMETQVDFTQTGGSNVVTNYSDLIEVKDWLLADRSLERKSLQYLNSLVATSGTPEYFARKGSNWILWPTPEVDTDMTIIYYSDQTSLTDDTDTNDLVQTAFSALIYGTLSVIGELFVDERLSQWEQRFQQETQELILNDAANEYAGSETAVMPPEGSVF